MQRFLFYVSFFPCPLDSSRHYFVAVTHQQWWLFCWMLNVGCLIYRHMQIIIIFFFFSFYVLLRHLSQFLSPPFGIPIVWNINGSNLLCNFDCRYHQRCRELYFFVPMRYYSDWLIFQTIVPHRPQHIRWYLNHFNK